MRFLSPLVALLAMTLILLSAGSRAATYDNQDEIMEHAHQPWRGDLDGITDIVAGAKHDDDGGVDRGALWTLFMQQTETDIDFTLFDNKN